MASRCSGRDVAGAVIIDADEVVCAVGGGGLLGAAVEEDDGDARGVHEFHDAGIDQGAGGAEFEGREEDAGDTARDGLARELHGLLFLAGGALLGVGPEESVSGSVGRGGDALADGFEDFGLAEVGDDEAEEQAAAALVLGAAHVGAGAGDAVEQAALLEFADGAAHGDARGAEALDEGGLAGEFLSGERTFRRGCRVPGAP